MANDLDLEYELIEPVLDALPKNREERFQVMVSGLAAIAIKDGRNINGVVAELRRLYAIFGDYRR